MRLTYDASAPALRTIMSKDMVTSFSCTAIPRITQSRVRLAMGSMLSKGIACTVRCVCCMRSVGLPHAQATSYKEQSKVASMSTQNPAFCKSHRHRVTQSSPRERFTARAQGPSQLSPRGTLCKAVEWFRGDACSNCRLGQFPTPPNGSVERVAEGVAPGDRRKGRPQTPPKGSACSLSFPESIFLIASKMARLEAEDAPQPARDA